MRIIDEMQLDFDDISIMPKRSTLNSRCEVDLHRTFKWSGASGGIHELTCIPIISAIMTTVGTPEMARFLVKRDYLASIEKHYDAKTICKLYDELERDAVADGKDIHHYTDKISMAVGINDSLETIKEVMLRHKVNIIHVDCPNAYIPNFKKRVREVRELLPEAFLIAGVVVTSDLTTDLVNIGVNCISLFICSGSVCVTAQKTGVRRGLVSTIIECADAAHQQNAYVLASGGLRNPADFAKAFGCGADICMTGSMFAATDEAAGDIITKRYLTHELDDNGNIIIKSKKFKKYFGMSSTTAQKLLDPNLKGYRTSEGREKLIEYKGPMTDVLKDIEGGIRSTCCYIGARNMKEISKKCTFYRCTQQLNTVFEKCEDFS